MKSVSLFYLVRVFTLLMLLIGIGMHTWLTHLRTTDWNNSLWIAIYPINADQSKVSKQYIDRLKVKHFTPVSDFISREAKRYENRLHHPVTLVLANEVRDIPPQPKQDGSVFETMWWSLKMRYWSMQHDAIEGPEPDVRIFVLYHDPEQHEGLNHSLGLEKGLIGVVNAYASKQLSGRNQLIIAHEFLHTIGATDKYNLESGQPIYPEGYAEPDKRPRLPQRYTEVMGGRKAISKTKSAMPRSLKSVLIGSKTAIEIGWSEQN